MLPLALVLISSLGASPAVVGLSRRAGVAAPKALALAKDVSAALTGVPMAPNVEDLTACRSKKVCLLQRARQLGASVLVTVEVSSVLDASSLRVEALSIDDDGARLGLVEVDGPLASLVEKASVKLANEVAPAIRTTMGLVPPPTPPVVTVTSPTPPPVAPPVALVMEKPTPAQPPPTIEVKSAPTVVPPPTEPKLSSGRIVGLTLASVGAASLVGAGVLGVVAMTSAAKSKALCPPSDGPCGNTEGFVEYNRAARAQNVGVVLAIGGAVALATGAVVFFTSPRMGPIATVVPIPGGVVGQVSASW